MNNDLVMYSELMMNSIMDSAKFLQQSSNMRMQRPEAELPRTQPH